MKIMLVIVLFSAIECKAQPTQERQPILVQDRQIEVRVPNNQQVRVPNFVFRADNDPFFYFGFGAVSSAFLRYFF
jgi:hypothetical protein